MRVLRFDYKSRCQTLWVTSVCSGVKGLGLDDARRSYTDSIGVQGQGLGTALARGQGEGVYPKKSLQWTRGLVIRGETMYLLLLNR